MHGLISLRMGRIASTWPSCSERLETLSTNDVGTPLALKEPMRQTHKQLTKEKVMKKFIAIVVLGIMLSTTSTVHAGEAWPWIVGGLAGAALLTSLAHNGGHHSSSHYVYTSSHHYPTYSSHYSSRHFYPVSYAQIWVPGYYDVHGIWHGGYYTY